MLGGILFPIWLQIAHPAGDLFGRWTDHLRHEVEAVALLQQGPRIFGLTWGEATRDVPLPCPTHADLWPETGIPYPPAGILLHAPAAVLERVLPPAFIHRALTFGFGVIGLLASVWTARQLKGVRGWIFAVLFGPLLVGVGLCGFYDTVWVALALVAVLRQEHRLAVASFLIHFRGVVGLPVLVSNRPGPIAVVAIAAHFVLALFIARHLGDFPLDSPLHWTRPVAWWFPVTTLVVIGLTWRDGLGWLLAAAAMALFVDRQAAFWHLLVLAPVAARSLQVGTVRTAAVVLGWCVITAQAFIDSYVPFPLQWLTLR